MSSNSNSFEEDIIEQKLYKNDPSYYVRRMKLKKEKLSQLLDPSEQQKVANKGISSKDPQKRSNFVLNIINLSNSVIRSNIFQIGFTLVCLVLLIFSSYQTENVPITLVVFNK